MRYPLAERFKAPQGEGLYTGTQMAFVRMVGCSVGQAVCTACDTDFASMRPDLGGGLYGPAELLQWAAPCMRLCVTGGEPLDRDLRPLLWQAREAGVVCHVETSGTRWSEWLDHDDLARERGVHVVGMRSQSGLVWYRMQVWLCVSPKPGYLPAMIGRADEVKVIHGGLGDGPGWPTVEDALRWADAGKLVYLQPRNERLEVDRRNLDAVLEVVARHPQLRLSAQLHKFTRTR